MNGKTKKIVSAMLIIASLGINVPAYVTAKTTVTASEFEDYVKSDERPANIIMTDQGASTSASRNFRAASAPTDSAKISFSVVDTNNWVTAAKNYGEQKLTAKDVITENINYGFEGVYMSSASSYLSTMERLLPGESYVISFKAKNNGETSAKLGVAVSNGTSETLAYSKEYGKDGMELGAEYQEFKATVKTSENFDSAADNVISIGFPEGTAAGTEVYFDTSTLEAVYFGKEAAQDITNEITSEKDSVFPGGRVELKAEVKNQLGLPGNLLQEFSWYVLSEDKTVLYDEFEITESENSAEVTIPEDAESGIYSVVAVSDEYDMVRTCKINVLSFDIFKTRINDVMPANIIMTDQGANTSASRNFRAASAVTSSSKIGFSIVDTNNWVAAAKNYGEQKLTAKTDITKNAKYGFEGIYMSSANTYLSTMERLLPGKSYVISFKAKNNGETSAKLGVAVSNGTSETLAYSEEFGEEGMELGAEYQEFKATVKTSENFDSAADNVISIGFPEGTVAGTEVYFDTSSIDAVYFGEEVAREIKLLGDRVPEIAARTTIDVKAEVVNQLGIPGTLSQDVSWYVIDEAGTKIIDTADIVPYNGGAVITFNEAISEEINIFAVSEEHNLSVGFNPVQIDLDEKKVIYVSPSGNDNDTGTEARPLRTLEAARDEIRDLKAQGHNAPVDVILREGTYYFDKTLQFTEEDSRAQVTKVTYKAAEGEKVVFTGAVEIDLEDAKALTDSTVISRLKSEALKDKIIEIDLEGKLPYSFSEDNAIKSTIEAIQGTYEYPAVYLDGYEQRLAQWPDKDGEYKTYTFVDSDTIGYSEDEPSRWTGASDWWIGGFLSYDYLYMRAVASSVDAENKQISFVTGGDTVKAEDVTTETIHRWKAFNLLEELDTPMEWYIDRENSKLYFYPPYIRENSKLEISVLRTAMIDINEASNITFQDITFEKTRADAIKTTNVKNIVVTGCEFSDIGTNAFVNYGTVMAETDKDYWQRQYVDASYNCEISDCKFINIGAHSVLMDGGNVDDLTPSGNVIKNNIFFKGAQKIKNNETVELRGCGNTVEHNNISRTADIAIYYMGNDHKIRYNEIYNVMQEMDDSGAIYCGRNTVQRGTEIAYNYIHDLESTYSWGFNHRPAIYWDDLQTGQYAHHNIIRNSAINVYTNGVDNNYSYNTSVGISKTNIDFRNGGAADNANNIGTVFASNIKNPDIYYEKYPNLKNIVESKALTVDITNGSVNPSNARVLSGFNVIKGNKNTGGVTDHGIGTYTTRPNQGYTWGRKYAFFGDYEWSENSSAGTANANVASNNNNASITFVDAAAQDYRMVGTDSLETSILNENFDIELIGVQTDNSISDKVTILSPYNGEITNSETVNLMWDDSFGATSYTVTVATDKAFSNKIKTETVYCDTAKITLPINGETYYWKVTAQNTSREFASTWESEIYTFTNGEKISASVEVSGSKITAKIKNNFYQEGIDSAVMIAQYDETGKMVSVTSAENGKLTLTYGEEKTVAASLSDDIIAVKLFMWEYADGDLNGVPLRKAVTCNLASYPDYVPAEEIPENLFLITDAGGNTSASRNFVNGTVRNTVDVESDVLSRDEWVSAAKTYKEKYFYAVNDISKDDSSGYAGIVINNNPDDANVYFDALKKLSPSTGYVISFKVKNVGETDARLGVAISNGNSNTLSYSTDYGYEGILIGSEYETVGTAIKTSDNFNPDGVNIITIGFPEGTKKDTKVNFLFEDINSVYFAEEVAYDILIESDAAEVVAGGEILITSKVVNQIGLKGNLGQDIRFIAMDKEKTEEISGFNFDKNADGTVTVSVPDGISSGEYAIVAVSKDYKGFAKTLYIKINS